MRGSLYPVVAAAREEPHPIVLLARDQAVTVVLDLEDAAGPLVHHVVTDVFIRPSDLAVFRLSTVSYLVGF
jgi:hypothetical protein